MAIIQRTKGGQKVGNLIVRITDYDPRTGEARQREVATGTRDRAIAKRIQARLKEEAGQHRAEARQWAELRRKGLSDPVAESLAEHGKRELSAHLADFRAVLVARGRTAAYIDGVMSVCRQTFAACGFARPGDLDAVKVSEHLGELRRVRPVPERRGRRWGKEARRGRSGLSARSINRRVAAVKAFATWMFRNDRLRVNPFKQLRPLNVKADRRQRRRALDDGEIVRLLGAAETGPDFRGLSGADRAMLYRVALETGLRAGELASLTPEAFDLADVRAAVVTVEAAYTKSGETAEQPIGAKLAGALKGYLRGRPARVAVWRLGNWTAKAVRFDLAAARSAWTAEAGTPAEAERREGSDFLAAEDRAGQVVDFHCLRHTFITRLARAGVHPAVAQRLARHSSIELTMQFYTHLRLADTRGALDRLPDLDGEADRPARRAGGA